MARVAAGGCRWRRPNSLWASPRQGDLVRLRGPDGHPRLAPARRGASSHELRRPVYRGRNVARLPRRPHWRGNRVRAHRADACLAPQQRRRLHHRRRYAHCLASRERLSSRGARVSRRRGRAAARGCRVPARAEALPPRARRRASLQHVGRGQSGLQDLPGVPLEGD